MLRLASVDDQGQIDGDSFAVRAVGTACREYRDEDRPQVEGRPVFSVQYALRPA